jgi:D-beta-D-heptose 7-phosphate kinase/D-beta-D-heptose 1-phosphate adenosyltransferase
MIADRILPRDLLAGKLREARRDGRKVVFTNGCFDILHAGHVTLLEQARAQGDLLVVGLNSDASVRQIKGPTRPVNTERNRALVVAALASVDYVCLFGEPTPLELIRELEPDVLVKGSDWRGKGVVGASEVEARGGRVVLVELVPGESTSAIIERAGLAGGRTPKEETDG